MNRVYIKGDAIGAVRAGRKAMYVEGGGLTEAKEDDSLTLGLFVGVAGCTAYAVIGGTSGAFDDLLSEVLALDARGLVTRVAPSPGKHWGLATPRLDLLAPNAHQVLYSLEPALDDGPGRAPIGLVVVSSAVVCGTPEVAAFISDARGNADGCALAVEERDMSHARLLRRMGYTIAGWPR